MKWHVLKYLFSGTWSCSFVLWVDHGDDMGLRPWWQSSHERGVRPAGSMCGCMFLAALLVPFSNWSSMDTCHGAGDPCKDACRLHQGLEHPQGTKGHGVPPVSGAAEAVEGPEY